MLVGISGPSCSGKTTLAREIAAFLDAPTLHLDRHFDSKAERTVVNGHRSYERPEQYDGAALLEETRLALKLNEHVVVEGFILFSYPGFEQACDRMVHLDLPHHILARRRRQRAEGNDAAGDVKGGRIRDADAAWAAHGKSEWERFGAFQRDLRDMTVVSIGEADGRTPREIALQLLGTWASTPHRHM